MASREFAELEVIGAHRRRQGRRGRHRRREELLDRAGGGDRRARAPLPAPRPARAALLRSRLWPQPDGALGRAGQAREPGHRGRLACGPSWASRDRARARRRRVPRRRGAEPRRATDGFRLWWLGQSGFLVQWQGRHLLLDPYLSESLTKKYAATDKPHVRMTRRVVASRAPRLRRCGRPRATTTRTTSTARPSAPCAARTRAWSSSSPKPTAPSWPSVWAARPSLAPGPRRRQGGRGRRLPHRGRARGPRGRSSATRTAAAVTSATWFASASTRLYHPGDCVPYDGQVERLRPFARGPRAASHQRPRARAARTRQLHGSRGGAARPRDRRPPRGPLPLRHVRVQHGVARGLRGRSTSPRATAPRPPRGRAAYRGRPPQTPVSAEYDGILLGAGHNSLVLQAYLGRAGLTCSASSGATWPAAAWLPWKTSTSRVFATTSIRSSIGPIRQAPWYADLELEHHGAEYLEPELNVALVSKTGAALEWWTDFERTAASFARFSERDARTLRRWRDDFLPVVETDPRARSARAAPAPDRRRALLEGSARGACSSRRAGPLPRLRRARVRAPAGPGRPPLLQRPSRGRPPLAGFGHHIAMLLASARQGTDVRVADRRRLPSPGACGRGFRGDGEARRHSEADPRRGRTCGRRGDQRRRAPSGLGSSWRRA